MLISRASVQSLDASAAPEPVEACFLSQSQELIPTLMLGERTSSFVAGRFSPRPDRLVSPFGGKAEELRGGMVFADPEACALRSAEKEETTNIGTDAFTATTTVHLTTIIKKDARAAKPTPQATIPPANRRTSSVCLLSSTPTNKPGSENMISPSPSRAQTGRSLPRKTSPAMGIASRSPSRIGAQNVRNPPPPTPTWTSRRDFTPPRLSGSSTEPVPKDASEYKYRRYTYPSPAQNSTPRSSAASRPSSTRSVSSRNLDITKPTKKQTNDHDGSASAHHLSTETEKQLIIGTKTWRGSSTHQAGRSLDRNVSPALRATSHSVARRATAQQQSIKNSPALSCKSEVEPKTQCKAIGTQPQGIHAPGPSALELPALPPTPATTAAGATAAEPVDFAFLPPPPSPVGLPRRLSPARSVSPRQRRFLADFGCSCDCHDGSPELFENSRGGGGDCLAANDSKQQQQQHWAACLFERSGELSEPALFALRSLRRAQEKLLLQAASSQDVLLGSPPDSRELYERGCDLQAKLQGQLEIRRKNCEEQLLAECSFAPRINAAVSQSPKNTKATADHKQTSLGCAAEEELPPSSSPSTGSPAKSEKHCDASSSQQYAAAGEACSEESEAKAEVQERPLLLCHAVMLNDTGNEIPLAQRDRVKQMISYLHHNVARPISAHFGLRYDFILEQHCQERKAGVTRKEPHSYKLSLPNGSVLETDPRFVTTIRVRLRVHAAKGDPQKEFVSQGAQIAVLLHELAHLRFMDHGEEFMYLLKRIYAAATRMNVFDPTAMQSVKSEIRSSWAWENAIFDSGGDIEDEQLKELYDEQRARLGLRSPKSPNRGFSRSPSPFVPRDWDGSVITRAPPKSPRSVSPIASMASTSAAPKTPRASPRMTNRTIEAPRTPRASPRMTNRTTEVDDQLRKASQSPLRSQRTAKSFGADDELSKRSSLSPSSASAPVKPRVYSPSTRIARMDRAVSPIRLVPRAKALTPNHQSEKNVHIPTTPRPRPSTACRSQTPLRNSSKPASYADHHRSRTSETLNKSFSFPAPSTPRPQVTLNRVCVENPKTAAAEPADELFLASTP